MMTGTRRWAGSRKTAGTRQRASQVVGLAGLAVAALALAGLALALAVAGCSSGASAVTAGGSCGSTRTAANVPVAIRVTRGTVDCAVALGVEQEYATMIRKGEVPGTGGGAPVRVHGWTCQGYPTPQVLRTGNASQCHTAKAEVVAVLAVPSAGS
jgi:hypothetical protein